MKNDGKKRFIVKDTPVLVRARRNVRITMFNSARHPVFGCGWLDQILWEPPFIANPCAFFLVSRRPLIRRYLYKRNAEIPLHVPQWNLEHSTWRSWTSIEPPCPNIFKVLESKISWPPIWRSPEAATSMGHHSSIDSFRITSHSRKELLVHFWPPIVKLIQDTVAHHSIHLLTQKTCVSPKYNHHSGHLTWT